MYCYYTIGQSPPTIILNLFRKLPAKLDAFCITVASAIPPRPANLCGATGFEPVRAEAQLFPLALFIAVSIYWRSIRVPPSEFQIDSLV